MTRSRRTTALLGLFAVAALFAACGDDGDDPVQVGDGGDDAVEAPESDDVVVSVETVGAFTTAETSFQTMPSVVVYGDGTQITPGAQMAIYPGPALPAVQQTQLSGGRVAEIVRAARDAGLDREGLDYGQPPVADAGDTVVIVNIDGTTYEHRATALGLAVGLGGDATGSGLTDEQIEHRAALAEFVDVVSTIPVEADTVTYEPDRYRLWVRPASGVDTGPVDEDNTEPLTVAWTVEAVSLEASMCLPVEGEAADSVGALLADADILTRFDDGSTTWAVVARPVLPHEPTCPDV